MAHLREELDRIRRQVHEGIEKETSILDKLKSLAAPNIPEPSWRTVSGNDFCKISPFFVL